MGLIPKGNTACPTDFIADSIGDQCLGTHRYHNPRRVSRNRRFRRVANRHDKLVEYFLATVQLVPMRLWFRGY
ncbi:transposase [Sphingomonas sp. UYP23]